MAGPVSPPYVGYRQLYLTRPYLRGSDVLAVQQRLQELGFDPFVLDGLFGPMTQEAVLALQRSRGLAANGVVDDATFRVIGFRPTEPTPPAPGGPWGHLTDVRLLIDTTYRRLSVFSGSEAPLRVYPCAVGKPSTPTPVGDSQIATKVAAPDWPVLGSRWMGLSIQTGNYGIHGTNNDASIGQAVSNGCIRLHNWHVEELFDWAVIGTPVKISRPGGGDGGGGGPGTRPALSLGSTGPNVADLQSRLRSLDLYRGAIDGVFGAETRAAVIVFQETHGLEPDGVVGPLTWRALGL